MGETTADSNKHEDRGEVMKEEKREKQEKHEDGDIGKEKKGDQEKTKDTKKKDKDGKVKEDKEGGKEKKKKSPEDKMILQNLGRRLKRSTPKCWHLSQRKKKF
ncbi:hypothetical protein SLA2020_444870 [Shorea laevis]